MMVYYGREMKEREGGRKDGMAEMNRASEQARERGREGGREECVGEEG